MPRGVFAWRSLMTAARRSAARRVAAVRRVAARRVGAAKRAVSCQGPNTDVDAARLTEIQTPALAQAHSGTPKSPGHFVAIDASLGLKKGGKWNGKRQRGQLKLEGLVSELGSKLVSGIEVGDLREKITHINVVMIWVSAVTDIQALAFLKRVDNWTTRAVVSRDVSPNVFDELFKEATRAGIPLFYDGRYFSG